jgi:hypothetical protein
MFQLCSSNFPFGENSIICIVWLSKNRLFSKKHCVLWKMQTSRVRISDRRSRKNLLLEIWKLKNILENRIHVVINVETPTHLPSFPRLKFKSSSIACGFRTSEPKSSTYNNTESVNFHTKIKINYFHSQIKQQSIYLARLLLLTLMTQQTIDSFLWDFFNPKTHFHFVARANWRIYLRSVKLVVSNKKYVFILIVTSP